MTAIATPANARSQRTRAALLGAGRELIETEGFASLTMEAVAARAGVTRRSVYLHFASRAELVRALFDHVAEVEGLRDSLAEVWAAVGAEATLDAWAAHVSRYHPRLIAVDRAILAERTSDPDAAAHRARVVEAKMSGCRTVIGRIASEGRLARGWDVPAAAEMLFYLDSSDLIDGLLNERGWSRRRFAERYATLLRRVFLTGSREASR